MAELQALCMKCKQKGEEHQMQDMENIEVEEKDGRYSARGQCASCGGNMFKFLSKEDAKKLQG